jgi:hypothetical protein
MGFLLHFSYVEGVTRRRSRLLLKLAARPRFQTPELLQRLQTRSPDQALSKGVLHLRQFRIFV